VQHAAVWTVMQVVPEQGVCPLCLTNRKKILR